MTYQLPKRRARQRSGIRKEPQYRSPGYLRSIRKLECACAKTLTCCGEIEAAHVRTGTDGGASVKPSDFWTIPLCHYHHAQQHRIGELAFEKQYAIEMKAIASGLWRRDTTYRLKYERDHAEQERV